MAGIDTGEILKQVVKAAEDNPQIVKDLLDNAAPIIESLTGHKLSEEDAGKVAEGVAGKVVENKDSDKVTDSLLELATSFLGGGSKSSEKKDSDEGKDEGGLDLGEIADIAGKILGGK